MDIQITPQIAIPESEIKLVFTGSSGPGGQHVNKVATAVKLRFDVGASPNLPAHVKKRLRAVAGRRLTKEGILVIDARRYRSQEQNRREAMDRLAGLLRKAAFLPKTRRKTKPPATANARRLAGKLHRARLKRKRRTVKPEGDWYS